MLNLLYFARLKDVLGRDTERIDLPSGVTDVNSLIGWLRQRGGAWDVELAPARPVRVAVNQDMAKGDTPVRDGDEIAVFPPVTGG
ncbi:MAG: molybdopterin converting factor subunit 1 [Burkholderiales bacterium]